MTAGTEGDVVYNFANGFHYSVEVLLTNKPSITWMRALVTMQAALFSGAVVEHVAMTVGKEVENVMEMNFYKFGDHSCTKDIDFGKNNPCLHHPAALGTDQTVFSVCGKKGGCGGVVDGRRC